MRDTKNIRRWMAENRWRQCDIQRSLRYAHATPVWETIAGRRDSRRVLQWFVDHGCPVSFLDLPEDMKAAA